MIDIRFVDSCEYCGTIVNLENMKGRRKRKLKDQPSGWDDVSDHPIYGWVCPVCGGKNKTTIWL